MLERNPDHCKALGHHGLEKISAGVVESWDITTLARLLLNDLGLLQRGSPQYQAVQVIRRLRNDFVHSLHECEKLGQAEFDRHWGDITRELGCLMADGDEQARRQYAEELEAILREGVDLERSARLATELEDLRTHLQGVRDDIDALQGEQVRIREALANAATVTEVDRRITAEVQRRLQDLRPESKVMTITVSSGARYEVLLGKRLGGGAMGTVYEARDLGDGQLVAVKLCRDAGGVRGDREAQNLEGIVHDNVVRYLGCYRGEETGGGLAVAMELVVGVDYATYLSAHAPLVWRRAARDMRQLLAGLAAVHARGVAHRDVKPANVVRKADGRLVLVDFGLSKAEAELVSVVHARRAVG